MPSRVLLSTPLIVWNRHSLLLGAKGIATRSKDATRGWILANSQRVSARTNNFLQGLDQHCLLLTLYFPYGLSKTDTSLESMEG